MSVDLGRGRLLVAELGNDSVDVVDLEKGRAIGRISGLSEPQGVAFEPSSDLVVIANGGDGTVRMFHAGDLSPSGEVSLGDDADNVRLDPQHGQVIVGYGSGGLAVVDPSRPSMLADIKLAAHPEAFQLDPKTRRLFVNVPTARQIAVIDLGSRRQIATWTVPQFRSNFPLALDQTGSLLATVFRTPAELVLIDTRSGAVAESLPTCADADDVFFDFKRRLIYISCGEGAVDVFQSDEAGTRQLARVKTSSGARTSLFVPQLDRLFVAARASRFGSQASILVFRPIP
jgi:DNA-binding beta-propeller fold protein YncE